MQIRSKDIHLTGKRCLIVSDIHAHLHLLKKALKKAQYLPGVDILIVLGDCIEKGPDNLATIHYLMELSSYPNVYIVSGNCDAIPVAACHPSSLDWVYRYLHEVEWKEQTLIKELCRIEQLSFASKEELAIVLQKLQALYPSEFAFLSSLPHVLRSEEYLFAHGGIMQEEEPYASSPHDIMKNDYFATKDIQFQRTLVCGHTPVMNYDKHYFDCNPHFDQDKNILSIDGGCGVKDFGQVNVVILSSLGMKYQYVDDLPIEVIQEAYVPTPKESHCIAWMDNSIEILNSISDSTKCRQCSTGIEMDIPTEYLFELSDGWHTHDYSDYHLRVEIGDKVGIITTWKELVYVKKDGVLGWIPKTCLSHPKP